MVSAAIVMSHSCEKGRPVLPEPVEDPMAIEFPPGLPPVLLGYPGDRRELPFIVKASPGNSLSVEVSTDGALSVSCAFDPSMQSGVLTLGYPEEQDARGRATLSLRDRTRSLTASLETKTYRLEIVADPVLLGPGTGSRAPLVCSVETDLPECSLVFAPAPEAFFAVDGEELVAMEDNLTGGQRDSYVVVSEAGGMMGSLEVRVSQRAFPPSPGEDSVAFRDAAFSAAMVSIADANGDGEVSLDEALAVREIIVPGKGIADLTGIEAFRNVWKLDARDNAIREASVLKELPGLYWLDLRGNSDLKTFDVTGCSLYFEHCAFDLAEGLVYYTTRNQVGVTNASDPECLHSRHEEDSRRTFDWSGQDELVLMRHHTKGDGYPAVFTGVCYIDVDMQDGSFERVMRRAAELMLESYPGMNVYGDYLDIYCVKHKSPSRNEYYLRDAECRFDNPACVETYQRFLSDETSLLKSIYRSLYGNTPVEMGMLSFLVECAPSGHPGRFAATLNFTGYYDDEDPFRYGPVVSLYLHRGMDDADESVYGGLSSQTLEQLFRNTPSGEDYDAFLRIISGN